MVASRRRINQRSLDFVGKGYRNLRRKRVVVVRRRKGAGKKDMDSLG